MNIQDNINPEEIALMIDFAMRIINALPEEELRSNYSNEIKTVINNYNEEVTLLKAAMEKHFADEERLGLPVNLSLRRSYQNLRFLSL